MDHLPTPRFPKHPSFRVSCYARPDFVCSGSISFHAYPDHQGWSYRSFIEGDFRQGHSDEQSRAFLQEWLYFKLMAAVFGSVGIDIDMDDFTRRDEGELLLDSTNLIRYISEFEGRFRDLGQQERMVAAKGVNRALSVAQRLVVRECSMNSSPKARSGQWPFEAAASLSFMILGSTLAFSVGRIVQVLQNKVQALELYKQLHIRYDSWGTSELLYQRMRDDNWCPHNMAKFASGGYSIVGMYYASLLDIPSDGHDHTDCGVRQCRHMKIDEKTYKTQHTHHVPPECELTIPDLSEIVRSLKAKSIPLLLIKEADDGAIEVEVKPYRDGIKYVAISHVWAHGLGNVEGNWLPSCQVRRLHRLTAALYPFTSSRTDTYLWIDTMCVPRSTDIDGVDYRKEAIDLLEDTYRKADKVLVLDEQLTLSPSRVTPEETLVRILSSGWMTRMWTLQEGLLADKLRFQLHGRALDSEDMLSDILPIHHSSVWLETYEFFSNLRVLRNVSPSKKLRHLWNYLQWRSTSHETDETICLSILTGKLPSTLHGLTNTDRMKAFLKQMDGIPSDIVFMPGPRLPGDGWKWAPDSFMARYQWTAYDHFQESLVTGASDHTMNDQTNISQRFEKGLRVHFPGITLSQVPHNLDLVFEVKETHMTAKPRFLVICLYDRCPPEWKDIDLRSLKNPTLILQAYPQAYGAIHAIFVDAYERPGLEGPVPLDLTAQVVTAARFICRANVSFVEPGPHDQSEQNLAYFRGDEAVSRSCEGRLLDNQWWDVG